MKVRATRIKPGDQVRLYMGGKRYAWKTVTRVKRIRFQGKSLVEITADGKHIVASLNCPMKRR